MEEVEENKSKKGNDNNEILCKKSLCICKKKL